MKSDLNSLIWGKLGNKYTPYQKKLFSLIFIIFTALLIYLIYCKTVYGNELPFTLGGVIIIIGSAIILSILGLLLHQSFKKSGLYQDQEYKAIQADHIPRFLLARIVAGGTAFVISLMLVFLIPGINFILQLVILSIITIPLYFIIYKKLDTLL